MSRHTSFQFRGEREGRVAQMSRQEEVIARKRQELLEKQRTNELAKQVVAAQSNSSDTAPPVAAPVVEPKHPLNLPQQTFTPDPPAAKNNFTNDGSFFENFRKITEAAKKAEEERQKVEAERLAKEKEKQDAEKEKAEKLHEQMAPPMPMLPMDSAFSTNSMGMGPPPGPMNDPNLFNQNIPPFINLAAPPPPPPPVELEMKHPIVPPMRGHGPPPPQQYNIQHAMAPPFAGPNIQQQPPPPPPPQQPSMAPQFSGPNIQNQMPPPHQQQLPPPPFAGPNMQQQPPQQQQPPPFEGNNYLNENQMNRNCGTVDQMERNANANPHHKPHSLPPMNSDMSMHATAPIAPAVKSTIPTTIDGLIEYIANNGDEYEEKILAEIAQMNERTLFRFLHDKNSENYKMYRNKVISYRVDKLGQTIVDSSEKYDPEDILCEDDNDESKNVAAAPLLNHPPAMQMPSCNTSDEYDSDSEYMQETMERNLENMKRRIDSGNIKKRYAESSAYSSDEADHTDEEDHMEMYRKIQMRENSFGSDNGPNDDNQGQQDSNSDRRLNSLANRKKRSRWGEKVEARAPPQQQQQQSFATPSGSNPMGNRSTPILSAVKRTDPALLNYARQNYGTVDLSEDDWMKCEEHFKVNLLYQDMLRKREEFDRLAKSGKHKYEYDSDEDTTGGTWEHKMRTAEMDATAAWADALTKQSEGKHHIGDFLPPEELKKFMEIYKSKQTNREPDLSDYKEYKLKEDNKGFQMLQKLGWTEGQGLGIDGAGIVNPINKATQRDSNQGLGTTSNTTPEAGDNEYDAYRKRMMLAYRFRPNPLNNPRRAYY